VKAFEFLIRFTYFVSHAHQNPKIYYFYHKIYWMKTLRFLTTRRNFCKSKWCSQISQIFGPLNKNLLYNIHSPNIFSQMLKRVSSPNFSTTKLSCYTVCLHIFCMCFAIHTIAVIHNIHTQCTHTEFGKLLYKSNILHIILYFREQ